MTDYEDRSYPNIQYLESISPELSPINSRLTLNNGSNVLSIREIIKLDQDRRLSHPSTMASKVHMKKKKEPTLLNLYNTSINNNSEDRFRIKMEERMMKWKPSISNNGSVNGSMMYIEGTHPYQIDTPVPKVISKKNRKFSISGATDITETTLTNTILPNNKSIEVSWRKQNNDRCYDKETREYENEVLDSVKFLKDDNYASKSKTPFGIPFSENNSNFNNCDSPGTSRIIRDEEGRTTDINKNQINDIYQKAYGIQLPENYLESLAHFQTQQQKRNHKRQRTPPQMTQNPTSTGNWMRNCFSNLFPNCFQ